MARKLNILVIFMMNKYPMRATLWDQLYCFRHYSNHNCFYLNLSMRSVPRYLKRIEFDIIVFGTIFLANRVKAEWFEPMLEKARALKSSNAVRIAFPQDEHAHTDVLMDFLEEFDVAAVFSVGPPSEWPKLYDRPRFARVKFFNVLTGYLDDATVGRIDRLAAENRERDIDIGYRTWLAGAWLGRHGLLRQKIADLFLEYAPLRRLKTDISTRSEDTIWGDDWYKFLLRCKYTISVEGGSSVPDRDGTLKERIQAYQLKHPDAGFAEIERACFPNLDGTLNYVALSPRHLECCATRTCQILVAGDYNGILQAGRHYIELKPDFSNIADVLDQMEREDQRLEMTERAYREIVASRKYTYQSFVDFVLAESMKERALEPSTTPRSVLNAVVYYWMRLSELATWAQVALHLYDFIPHLKGLVRRSLLGVFSEQTVVSMLGRVKPNKRETD
ncbi:MAG: hypothetical protein QOF02_3995 [Blastocatellia bacterium]|jgi:hypothetical protein|nr:hypothetical protein [Blastocatellia bacterium]